MTEHHCGQFTCFEIGGKPLEVRFQMGKTIRAVDLDVRLPEHQMPAAQITAAAGHVLPHDPGIVGAIEMIEIMIADEMQPRCGNSGKSLCHFVHQRRITVCIDFVDPVSQIGLPFLNRRGKNRQQRQRPPAFLAELFVTMMNVGDNCQFQTSTNN
jgi:hypothetical protein